MERHVAVRGIWTGHGRETTPDFLTWTDWPGEVLQGLAGLILVAASPAYLPLVPDARSPTAALRDECGALAPQLARQPSHRTAAAELAL